MVGREAESRWRDESLGAVLTRQQVAEWLQVRRRLGWMTNDAFTGERLDILYSNLTYCIVVT